MPTDSYTTADEPSQFLGKHSFVFVCVSIICNWIRTEHNVFMSFNTMPIGKVSGYDLISNVMNILCMRKKNYMFVFHCYTLFGSMLMHVFLPDTMMVAVIAAIIRNKSGDLLDNNNYRLILHTTIASKLFESSIIIQCYHICYYMYTWQSILITKAGL